MNRSAIFRRKDTRGAVYTERRFEMLGEFGGQRFDAELETSHGRDTATFLVNERTRGVGGVGGVGSRETRSGRHPPDAATRLHTDKGRRPAM